MSINLLHLEIRSGLLNVYLRFQVLLYLWRISQKIKLFQIIFFLKCADQVLLSLLMSSNQIVFPITSTAGNRFGY